MSIRSGFILVGLALLPGCVEAQSHDHSHGGNADPTAAGGAAAMGGPIVQTPHLKLTAMRAPSARDSVRGEEILRGLREGIEPYRDYRKAIEDGYRIFLPNVPMKVYHFTNYRRGDVGGRSFDARKPARCYTNVDPAGATPSWVRCMSRERRRQLTSSQRARPAQPRTVARAREHLRAAPARPPAVARNGGWEIEVGHAGAISTKPV